MKLFDLHADIGYDIIQKQKQHMQNVLRDQHLVKFRKGEITYVCMAAFFDGRASWQDMQQMVLALKAEIAICDEVDLVLDKKTLLDDNGHVKAILTVEGMCGIQEQPKTCIRWLYDAGVRIASLCWNEENALATGVRGNPNRGLSVMGKQAVEEMIALGMVIDVSHANEKTFWDILAFPDAKIIATHSNVRDLCDHPRNLWKAQIQAILNRHGIIGAVSAPDFVSSCKEKQDILHLCEHIAYIHNMQKDAPALGFDFMDFYEDEDYGETQGLHDASDAQNIVTGLSNFGFALHEQQAITYQNAKNYLINYVFR